MRRLALAIVLCAAPSLRSQPPGRDAAQSGSPSAHQAEGAHDNTQIYWKWANFAVLAGLIGFAIARKGGAFFRGRTEEIRKDIQEAARRKQQAEVRAAEIDRRMAELAAEIGALRADARREMAAEAERARQQSARMLAKIEAGAAQEIAALAKQARRALRERSARLALELAERRIRGRLGVAEDSALIAAFVDQIGGGARVR